MSKCLLSSALSAAASVVSLIIGLHGQPLAAQDAPGTRENVLEEIIVTARKHDESLREIPESVSAISAFDLEKGHISHINDIGLRVTNLNLSSRADGNPNVTIRGIGSFGNT